MVLDHPDLSELVEQPVLEVVNVPDDEDAVMQQPAEEEPVLALVPYVPPPIPPLQVFVGMIKIVAGPELPPEMQWSRAFSRVMPELCSLQVPRSLNLCPALPLICSKRSWSMAFDESSMELSITFIADDAGPPAFAPPMPAVEIPMELTFSSPPDKDDHTKTQEEGNPHCGHVGQALHQEHNQAGRLQGGNSGRTPYDSKRQEAQGQAHHFGVGGR